MCHTPGMANNGSDPVDATLRLTLSAHRVLPYDECLTVACFDHGIRLAQAGADLPDWLATATRWARAAVVVGRSSALRVIQEDRLLGARSVVKVINPVLEPQPFWRRWMD